jgi:membrane protease YdiL (CAAX protease family)
MTAMAAVVLTHLLIVYTVLVWPVLGRRRYLGLQKKLRAQDPHARTRAYRRTILHQWAVVSVVAIIMALGRIPPAAVGLRKPAAGTLDATTLLILLAVIGLSGFFFRWKADRYVQRMLKMAGAILPVTVKERWLFSAVSIGAGVSEELLFRGFLLYYLHSHFPDMDAWMQIPISSFLFGFAHLFQGWRGVVVTAALGAVLTLLYIGTASLLPPMLIHAAIDLRILMIVTPERMRTLGQAAPAE